MSPSRTRKPISRLRSRRELYVAIAAGVAVVGGTVLLVWLLRPGPPGTNGTGGLLSRQQRASLLFFITLVALIAVIWFLVKRYRGNRVPRPMAIVASVVVILVLALIAGILWPGGLVKHYQSLVNVPNTPVETPTTVPSPGTNAPASTTPPTARAPSTPTTG